MPYTERFRAEACGNIELTFYDLLGQLHTGHDAPCVEEALEAEHWTHAAFYPPVILFDNIVQVGASADLDGIFPTVIELIIHAHAAQSGMGESIEAIQGNYSRGLAVALETLTEKGLGGGDVTRSTEIGVALYLNRDWKEPGGLDRNSAFMVRWRVRPTRRKHALEHHSGVRRRRW